MQNKGGEKTVLERAPYLKHIQQLHDKDKVFKAQNRKAKIACEGNATMRVTIHRENSFFMIVRS